MPEIRKYPVIISATHDKRWDEGLGRLYEPFEESEEGYLYSILHVEASVNVPHGQCGYYPVTSATVDSARKNGLVLTDGQGNQSGFDRPELRPCGSLEEALQHLEKHMHLQSEEVRDCLISFLRIWGVQHGKPPSLKQGHLCSEVCHAELPTGVNHDRRLSQEVLHAIR